MVTFLPAGEDSQAAAAAMLRGGAESAWLDTAMRPHADGAASSLIATEPIAVLEQWQGAPAEFRVGERVVDTDQDFLALLRRQQARLAIAPDGPPGPGWIGYFGFELAAQLECVPTHVSRAALPLARFALFDTVTRVVEGEGPREEHAPYIRRALGLPPRRSGENRRETQAPIVSGARSHATVRVTPETRREEFEAWVRRAREYIAAGDIYQVNLAHRLRLDGIDDPLDAYTAIRSHNPAPMAAYLRFGDAAVLSASPELFLRVRGDDVLTSPIKGTRPRAMDGGCAGIGQTESAARDSLLTSEKDAAELAMIVDLHRNDLSRVCAPGSVSVMVPRRVEAHPRVLHTVADIVGRLSPGRDALDLVAACFPPGSISGVPKIRALEIIHELEPVPRGVYTGAIGHLGLNGDMTLSVAIRTIQWRGGTAHLHVGAGIVAESEPAAEYAETLAKARGLLEALGCDACTFDHP